MNKSIWILVVLILTSTPLAVWALTTCQSSSSCWGGAGCLEAGSFNSCVLTCKGGGTVTCETLVY